MTSTLPPFAVSRNIKPAADAFDMDAVRRVDIASARVVRGIEKYAVEFDDVVTLDGRKVDVKVLYSHRFYANRDHMDVYRLNAAADPVEPEMAHWLAAEDFARLFRDALRLFEEREERENEAARDAHDCREYHNAKEHGEINIVHSDSMNF